VDPFVEGTRPKRHSSVDFTLLGGEVKKITEIEFATGQNVYTVAKALTYASGCGGLQVQSDLDIDSDQLTALLILTVLHPKVSRRIDLGQTVLYCL